MKKKNKYSVRILSLILTLILLVTGIPFAKAADVKADDGTNIADTVIRVLVKNEVYSVENGAPWEGVLLDTYVKADNTSTMKTVIRKAMEDADIAVEGLEAGYITSVSGLSEYDYTASSGYMITLNDWFTDKGMESYAVSDGSLQAGDIIAIEYTGSWGSDIGSYWNDNTTSLTGLSVSDGSLDKTFKSDVLEYKLALPDGSDSITVTPKAYNRNFQVRIYKNEYTPTVLESGFRAQDTIKVSAGDKLYIGVGNSAWPTANAGALETVYVVNIADDKVKSAEVTMYAGYEGAFLYTPGIHFKVRDGLAEEYGYTMPEADHNGDSVEAPTVFDALVAVHKAKYGDSFTKDTAKNYLSVSEYGYLEKAFGLDAASSSFFVNNSIPDDGIEGIYGTTGYMVNTARIADGDKIDFFFYQDTSYYLDYFTYFDKACVTVSAGTPVTLTLKGFMCMSAYGSKPVAENINGADGYITLHKVMPDGSLGEALLSDSGEECLVGADGDVILTFDEPGTYMLTANGFEGNYYSPIVLPYCEVTVIPDDTDRPYFDNIELLKTSFANWMTGTTFSKKTLSYDVDFKSYSVSTFTFTKDTVFDSNKYTATAHYTDMYGEERHTELTSGKQLQLTGFGFGRTTLRVELTDRQNTSNTTTYIFNVNRPYDTTSTIKATSGISAEVIGRELHNTLYNGNKEGTMIKLVDGEESGTSVASNTFSYRTYLYEDAKSFRLKLTAATNYAHIQVNAGDKVYEVTNGGYTEEIVFGEDKSKDISIIIVSDDEYRVYGFTRASSQGTLYSLNVVKLEESLDSADMLTASTQYGDFYPEFSTDMYSYAVVIENGDELPTLKFTVTEGAGVLVSGNALMPDENGVYELLLKTANQTIEITGSNGLVNKYTVKALKKSKYDVPDRVVDYFAIDSQYTNAAYGSSPETTLAGSLKSLGNFGGYITYYYENAITDDPNNAYGMDFYVYGNSFSNGTSAAEPGQVYVSEDGEKWYALAGSNHYDDTTVIDYAVTYKKTEDGKTTWTDSLGNSGGKSFNWPKQSIYYMNELALKDSLTLRGVLLKSMDGSVSGDGTTAAMSGKVAFGYADYFVNGTIGADVNPYAQNAASCGFDIAWAVDEDGNPVHFENGIHYIKVATASNIYAGAFGEKSTEVSQVVRTVRQENAVGKTDKITGIIISDDNGEVSDCELVPGKYEYEVYVGASDTVKVSVVGADDTDNIYVNSTRIAYNESAKVTTGNKTSVTKSSDGKKFRVIVQNGSSEPEIYVFTMITESMAESANLREIYENTANYLNALGMPVNASVGGEWLLIGLLRSDYAEKVSSYGQEYFKLITDLLFEKDNDKLSAVKSTENSRVILALNALGYDPSNMNGYNLYTPLNDYAYVTRQGVNGAVWALIAADSASYELDANVRDRLIDFILQYQLDSGLFSSNGEDYDIDITAMAITALSPYADVNTGNGSSYAGNDKIREAISNAVEALSNVQNRDGSFGTASNAETTAQVIIALTTLGIDPVTDERFIKESNSAMDGLTGFYVGEGRFAHIYDTNADAMATEQAMLAMTAYYRMQSGKNVLFDMSDADIKINPVYEKPDKDSSEKDNGNSSESGKPLPPQTSDSAEPMLYVIIICMMCAIILTAHKNGKREGKL